MPPSTVSSIWRYPVKSMAGEELDRAEATPSGLRGDRVYALIDTAKRKVGSAKNVRRFGELLKWQARFTTPPRNDGTVPPVRVTLPDGTAFDSDQPAAAMPILEHAFGPDVSLLSTAPEGLMLEFAAGTLAGKFAQTTEVPVAGGAPPGTMFDYAAIHIITTSSLRAFEAAHPNGPLGMQRFRPNIVIDCGDEQGLVENAWMGRTLAIGPDLVLRISIPCPRCVMTTLARPDLPADAGILRTIASLNMQELGDIGRLPCAGVYADVMRSGRITRGDVVRIAD